MQQHMEDRTEPQGQRRTGQGDAVVKPQRVAEKFSRVALSPSALLPVWKHPAQDECRTSAELPRLIAPSAESQHIIASGSKYSRLGAAWLLIEKE